MKRPGRIALWVAVLVSLASAAWGDFYVVAAPSTVGTRINSLPCTITQPGFYYLAKNLSSTGNGIHVQADDVTLDLAGFTLTGPGSANNGINISGQKNVEVRNGTVRNFDTGIYAYTSVSPRIMSMRAESNATGIICWSQGALVMGCHAFNNSIGFDLSGSANILQNVAYNNSGHGFWLRNDPMQLVDKNVSYNNGTDWLNAANCTKGVNTP
jgi:nitrous oxidase accessory protein NosD